MLFIHLLLLFILSSFTVAAPVPDATSTNLDTGSTKEAAPVPHAGSTKQAAHDSRNPNAYKKRVGGYWIRKQKSVSEHCSFSRLVCAMDLIYLDRFIRGQSIPISSTLASRVT